jgi:hypothetical protein
MSHYGQYKFIIAEEMGDCMDCIFIAHSSVDHKKRIYIYHHKYFDGVGGLGKILTLFYHDHRTLPQLSTLGKPQWWQWPILFVKFLRATKSSPIQWQQPGYLFSRTGTALGFHYVIFSQDVTRKLYLAAQEMQVSLSTYLWFVLDRVLALELGEKSGTRTWISPINMRQNSQTYLNETASIIVKLSAQDDVKSHHQKIKIFLKNKYHFGGHLYSTLARFIGLKGLRIMAKSIRHSYFGVFSFLGDWGNGHGHIWTAMAPSSKIVPIAATAMQTENQLILNFQTHPSLNLTFEQSKMFLSKWMIALLKPLAEKNPPAIHSVPWEKITEIKSQNEPVENIYHGQCQ